MCTYVCNRRPLYSDLLQWINKDCIVWVCVCEEPQSTPGITYFWPFVIILKGKQINYSDICFPPTGRPSAFIWRAEAFPHSPKSAERFGITANESVYCLFASTVWRWRSVSFSFDCADLIALNLSFKFLLFRFNSCSDTCKQPLCGEKRKPRAFVFIPHWEWIFHRVTEKWQPAEKHDETSYCNCGHKWRYK